MHMCFRNSSEIDEWHLCFRIFLRVTNGIGVFSTFRELRIPYLFPDLGDGQKSWFLVITPIENRDCLRCVLSLFFGSLWFDLSYTYIYIYTCFYFAIGQSNLVRFTTHPS